MAGQDDDAIVNIIKLGVCGNVLWCMILVGELCCFPVPCLNVDCTYNFTAGIDSYIFVNTVFVLYCNMLFECCISNEVLC